MSDIGLLEVPPPITSADSFSTDVNNTSVSDFLGLSLPDEEDPLGLNPLSLDFPYKPDLGQSPFAISSLDCDLKNSHIRNGQPTPPPSEDKNIYVTGDFYASVSGPAVESPPEASRQRRRRDPDEEGEDHQTGHYKNDNVTKHRKLYDAKVRTSDHKKLGLTKRQKILERNRLAANKCRQKKKEQTQSLALRLKEQSEKKCRLESEFASLRCQILDLKNEVLKHAFCDDGRVRQQLAHMTKQIMCHDNSSAPKPINTAEAVSSSPRPATPLALHEPQPPDLLSFNMDDNDADGLLCGRE